MAHEDTESIPSSSGLCAKSYNLDQATKRYVI